VDEKLKQFGYFQDFRTNLSTSVRCSVFVELGLAQSVKRDEFLSADCRNSIAAQGLQAPLGIFCHCVLKPPVVSLPVSFCGP
jgi:hypothetical protein